MGPLNQITDTMKFLLASVAMLFVVTASAADIPATTPNPHAGGSMGAMHSGTAQPVDVGNVKVPKATGADARTVAEIVTGGPTLKNKTVVVRGKVVKFTPEVMGKNWVHIRDGSGTAADNTHDVLVTTKATTKVGDVIVVKGTVHTDVDLGSGYSFKVLVEDATLQKN